MATSLLLPVSYKVMKLLYSQYTGVVSSFSYQDFNNSVLKLYLITQYLKRPQIFFTLDFIVLFVFLYLCILIYMGVYSMYVITDLLKLIPFQIGGRE